MKNKRKRDRIYVLRRKSSFKVIVIEDVVEVRRRRPTMECILSQVLESYGKKLNEIKYDRDRHCS